MFSLNNETVDRLLATTIPSFQGSDKTTRNLGFGYIYYAFARALRPGLTVAIGSKAGFAPICLALGIKDNQGYGIGKIRCEKTSMTNPGELPAFHFIDPSYSISREEPNNWYGLGTWDNSEKVKQLWSSYGVDDIATHFKITSQEYVKRQRGGRQIDLLYIDGDHSYEGVQHDLNAFHELLAPGATVLTLTVDPQFEAAFGGGGHRAFAELSSDMYEKMSIPIFPGLGIAKKLTKTKPCIP